MAQRTLLSLSVLAISTVVLASPGDPAPNNFTPLANKRYQYPAEIPLKVDTDNFGRGAQHGVNQCGPQTEGQDSVCQTAFLNSLDDFCLWGPPNPDSTVGDTEGEAVAWCTKPGRGTRVIPDGALTGVQFMRTPDYIQVVGTIDQTKINIRAGDTGGEMDPHGADLRGNPLGGLFYSTGFASGGNNALQVIEWHNFMGSDTFCLKACDPAGPNAAHFCEHRFDRIGCSYNAPSKGFDQIKGTFESCKGENQDFPGVYFVDGQQIQYEQPDEALGSITSMPYQPRVPASSDCVAQPSAALYAGAVAVPTGAPAPAITSAAPSSSAEAVSSVAPSASDVESSAVASVTASISSSLSNAATASSTLQTVRPTTTTNTLASRSAAGTSAAQESAPASAASVSVALSSGLAAFFGVAILAGLAL